MTRRSLSALIHNHSLSEVGQIVELSNFLSSYPAAVILNEASCLHVPILFMIRCLVFHRV